MHRPWQRWLHACVTGAVPQGCALRRALGKVQSLLCHYEIPTNFSMRGPHFPFTLVPINYGTILGLWSGSLGFHYRESYWVLILPSNIMCCSSALTLRASLFSCRWTLMNRKTVKRMVGTSSSLLGCWGNDFRQGVSQWFLQQMCFLTKLSIGNTLPFFVFLPSLPSSLLSLSLGLDCVPASCNRAIACILTF